MTETKAPELFLPLKGQEIRIYTSIYDCPAWNYAMAGQEDHRYILKMDSYEPLPDIPESVLNMKEKYMDLYYQFLDKFGVSHSQDYILREYSQMIYHTLKSEIEGDRKSITFANIHRINIERAMAEKKKQKQTDIYDLAHIVGRFQGYRIDPKELNVVEFYKLVQQYEESTS
jgi:hypothetical protein